MKNELVFVRHNNGPMDNRAYVFASQHGYTPVVKCPFDGDQLGSPSAHTAGTIVFGGMFNAYDEEKHPFLKEEARWIAECMELGLPVLGICQGAQQIARLLGAHVGPHPDGHHEFGYFEIRPTPEGTDVFPASLHVTQAHFHTFDIPEGAVHLAESDRFPNQAFRYGDNVFGFQFHPECTIEGFRRWQKVGPRQGTSGVQTPDEVRKLMAEHDEKQADWFYDFMLKLFGSNK